MPRTHLRPRTALRLFPTGLLATGLLALAAAPPAAAREATAPAQAPSPTTETSEPAPVVQPFHRVAVLGASLTVGFGLKSELGAEVGFADFLVHALRTTAPRVETFGDITFFMQPDRVGPKLADEALALEPDLVVALDFLFWYAYGMQAQGDARLERLDIGLALLDRFECPLLVGDFPDMRPALQGQGIFGEPVLMEQQIPQPEVLARLNAKLRAWAAERPRVAVVPLDELVNLLRAGHPLVLRGEEWPGGEIAALFQPDLLHPTARGTALVALATLDALADAQPEFPEAAVDWSSQRLLERLLAATAEERAKTEERERRRAERRAERERRAEEEAVGSGGSAGGGSR